MDTGAATDTTTTHGCIQQKSAHVALNLRQAQLYISTETVQLRFYKGQAMVLGRDPNFNAGDTAKNVISTTADNNSSAPQNFSAPVALEIMAAHTSGELASRL